MAKTSTENLTPLAQVRINAGLSRENAAGILNVTMMTLTRYELGKTDVPIGVAEEMATLYSVPFDNIRNAIRETKIMKGVKAEGRLNFGRKQIIERAVKKSSEKALLLAAVREAENLINIKNKVKAHAQSGQS